MKLSLWLDRKEFRLGLVQKEEGVFVVTLGGKTFEVVVEEISKNEFLLNINGRVFNTIVNSNLHSHAVYVNQSFFKVEKKSALDRIRGNRAKDRKRDVKTSMPGRIIKILAGQGDEVEEGQPVLVLEAMKMQNEIKSSRKGRLSRVNFHAGDHAEAGSVLFTVE